ncbi:major facilitator superfamily domain-containing protein [Gautieria morchelliformis]|nr:major facilitator superfamily domain-containing protein [Gautieria morchelliformis]
MSETTPLLVDSAQEQSRSQDVYDRFTTTQKRVITTVISVAGIIGPFASGCFVPCVPEIAKDLNTTGTIINYTVGVYIFTCALGSLLWAPYAGFYGRQPVYLASLPLVCVGSLCAAASGSVAQLVIGRIIQGLGASCVLSVGAATISDVYRLEERGTAMGVFFGTILFGPTLAPLMGGVMATYASWRAMQLFIFSMGLTALISVAVFLPETSHPGTRGIDNLILQERFGQPLKRPKWRMVWLNPFKPLRILQGPVILFVALASGFSLMAFYVLMIPLSYTLGPRYGITNPAIIGACFFPSGIGSMIGAYTAGRLADRAVIEGRLRREGKWVPEDRLRATLSGALILLPLSVLIFGLTTQFVPGKFGLMINLVCVFINGVGIDIVLSPSATYLVDVLRAQSAEAMGVYSAFRNVFSAIACAGVLPMINGVGLVPTNALTALLAWFAFGLLWITIRYGEELRAWLDVGYTSPRCV